MRRSSSAPGWKRSTRAWCASPTKCGSRRTGASWPRAKRSTSSWGGTCGRAGCRKSTGGSSVSMHPEQIKTLARECGFELAGIAAAAPVREARYYGQWIAGGLAGEMGYLTDRRAGLLDDPRHLLPSARSILCVGKLYNGPQPYSTQLAGEDLAWISRYAWGEDYHQVLRRGLARVVDGLRALSPAPFEWKICVDTAPLLERAYARHAGLGWIAKNTCLINQAMGSWFFLGELLLSLDFAPDQPPPDRCGSCTRCIDACPTQAIVPTGPGRGPAGAPDLPV